MWWTVLSCCVVLGLVLESRRRWLAVRSLWDIAAPFLEAREPTEQGQRAFVAELNEATLEIGAGLAQAGSVPRSCAKAALSFAALMALLESAQLVRGDGTRAWLGPALSLSCGCVGALGCALIGRAAEAEARRLRADWATLIRRSARDVPTTRHGSHLKSGVRPENSVLT
ncbi:MAG TPA: hypothetical protein VMG12_23940 [Polyangiaceae bacterium]|nr:hypothetical protein [Polyangiaceae bacterium]